MPFCDTLTVYGELEQTDGRMWKHNKRSPDNRRLLVLVMICLLILFLASFLSRSTEDVSLLPPCKKKKNRKVCVREREGEREEQDVLGEQ